MLVQLTHARLMMDLLALVCEKRRWSERFNSCCHSMVITSQLNRSMSLVSRFRFISSDEHLRRCSLRRFASFSHCHRDIHNFFYRSYITNASVTRRSMSKDHQFDDRQCVSFLSFSRHRCVSQRTTVSWDDAQTSMESVCIFRRILTRTTLPGETPFFR